MQRKHVNIYTDGSCLGNPGPGGYGVVLEFGKHQKTLSKGFILTTNNRMELMAPSVALETLTEPCEVTITTDSQYVKNGINQWITGWKRNGWKTSNKKPVKNIDLWQRLDMACQRHLVTWKWVKGHSGHPQNELCDQLARDAANANDQIDDEGYGQ